MAQLASFFVEEEEGVWAAASFKLAGAIKRSADTIELYTAVPGVVLRLDGASATGTITMADGKTHAVRCASEPPPTVATKMCMCVRPNQTVGSHQRA